MECEFCKNKKSVCKCDGCKRRICKQCSNLTASELKVFELKERTMLFYCNDCLSGNSFKLFLTIIENKDKLIEAKEKIIECLEKNIEEQHEYKKPQTSLSYSQVAQKNKEVVIMVKPKDNKQQSNTTKEVIQEKINPQTVGTSISRVKYVKNGGVALFCDESGLNNLQNQAEQILGKEYEVAKIDKKNPKLKIFGVNKNDVNNDDDFINKIIFHNRINKDKDNFLLRVVHKQPCIVNTKNCHVIIEADPSTYNDLSKNTYIQTGWKGCKYEEYLNIVQCYKCWKFGHKANSCKSEKDICPKCSGDHKSGECQSTTNCCINCKHAVEVLKVTNLNYYHTAFDRQCECYKRIYNQIRSKVDYPDISQFPTLK